MEYKLGNIFTSILYINLTLLLISCSSESDKAWDKDVKNWKLWTSQVVKITPKEVETTQNNSTNYSKYIRKVLNEDFTWSSLEKSWYENTKITEDNIIKIIYEIRKDVARWMLIKWHEKFYGTVPRYTTMGWDYNESLKFQQKLGITEEEVEKYLIENTGWIDSELNKWLTIYASSRKISKLLLTFTNILKDKCLIKWNISTLNGNKIYHLPESSFYYKTTIDKEKWERWFCTEDEAINAWWKKEEATWNINNKLTPTENKILEDDYNDQKNDNYYYMDQMVN